MRVTSVNIEKPNATKTTIQIYSAISPQPYSEGSFFHVSSSLSDVPHFIQLINVYMSITLIIIVVVKFYANICKPSFGRMVSTPLSFQNTITLLIINHHKNTHNNHFHHLSHQHLEKPIRTWAVASLLITLAQSTMPQQLYSFHNKAQQWMIKHRSQRVYSVFIMNFLVVCCLFS